MLVDDVLNEAADAVARTAEDAGNLVHALKRVIAYCHLMFVVLSEFNRSEESRAVIFEVELAQLGVGARRFGLSGRANLSGLLSFGKDRVFHRVLDILRDEACKNSTEAKQWL